MLTFMVPTVKAPPPPPIPDTLHPFIPNLITPNGDTHNEAFAFKDLGPGPYQLRLYNQWGGAGACHSRL